MCGKGSKRRPCLVSEAELSFRWDYGMGKYPDMPLKQFNIKVKEIRKQMKSKL